jgi:hypothetical protein
MKPLLALLLLIFPAATACQGLPSLDVLLNRLDAYAKQYQAAIPSLSCDEQVASQALNKKGKVTWEMKIESSLREIRTDDAYGSFLEKREFKIVDGRRPRTTFQTSQLPYFVEGGFAGLVGFKRWEQRECFDYVVTSGDQPQTIRLEMTLKTKYTNPSCARIPAGFHRIVIAEPTTGRILHTERTIAPQVAARTTEAYFGGIDYAPQKLGDEIFWLPSRFYAHDAQNTRRMFASYSNYHRYTGELKILPGLSISGASPAAQFSAN